VKLVLEHQAGYDSQWAAIGSVASKIGCTAETLRGRVRQHERDTGRREGMTTTDKERIKQLEREVRELRQANEILRKASAYFAQAGPRPSSTGWIPRPTCVRCWNGLPIIRSTASKSCCRGGSR